MKQSEKQYVLNLAEESAKLNEYQSKSDFLFNIDPCDIIGWNGDCSRTGKSIYKPDYRIEGRNSMKRNSNSEPPMFNSIQPPVKSTVLTSRRTFSRDRKPARVTPRIRTQRVHYVHAPFPLNPSSRFLAIGESRISLVSKFSEPASPLKMTQRQVFFSNYTKRPDDPSQIKAQKKTPDSVLDVIKTLKPRYFSKVHSSLH